MAAMATLRRGFWLGKPEGIREYFTLRKPSGAWATCALWTHQLELRLDVEGVIVRTHVTRSPADTDTVAESWRVAMVAAGVDDLNTECVGRLNQGVRVATLERRVSAARSRCRWEGHFLLRERPGPADWASARTGRCFALHSAHRFRCAAAMRLRALADRRRRLRPVTAPGTASPVTFSDALIAERRPRRSGNVA
jgi:hypothetical protein